VTSYTRHDQVVGESKEIGVDVEVVGSSPITSTITSTAVEIATFGLVNGHFVFPIAR